MWKSETRTIHVPHQCIHMLHVLNFHWYGLVLICSREDFQNFTELLKSSHTVVKRKCDFLKIYTYTHKQTEARAHTHTHTHTLVYSRPRAIAFIIKVYLF